MKKLVPLIITLFLFSCQHEVIVPLPETGYPDDVAKIIVNKCAVAGCHNTASRFASGGLDFSTWDLMFDGGRNGTSVIPYSDNYSYLLYSINTDPNRGPVLLPTMPYQQAALSNDEYQTLVNWIHNGAPDKTGFVKFSDDPLRKKVYICMQGCDKVAVVDANTKVIMRYISVGANPGSIEAPHLVRVSPDGNYWYVVFYAGSVLQKYRTSDDALVASLDIGSADWNTIIFNPDGVTGYVSGTQAGITQVVNLETMTVKTTLHPNQPHGGFVTPDGHYLYLTSQIGNFLTKIDVTDTIFYDDVKIPLVPGQPISTSSSLDPHEAKMSPDGSKYFVSCQTSNEVRVFDATNDNLIKVFNIGVKPQEFDVSENFPYIFVTCTETPISATEKGAVFVINYNDLTVVTGSPIYTGFQPHGLAVDDQEGIVYVANLNYDPNGPVPHHVSACGGRNGYLTIIDMNTLLLYNKTLSDGNSFQYKTELLPFPYFVTIRK